MDGRIIKALDLCFAERSKITFLVGAGISADSGIPTFRGKDGYWVSGSKNYKAEEIGTYEMFSKASMEVWKWYLYRKSITEKATPNAGHIALVKIEESLGDRFALVSQNVDSLHRRAGNSEERTYLIHGDFDYVRCGDECTSELYPFPKEVSLVDRNKDVITAEEWEALKCPRCGEDLRPHVLWFDESYDEKYYKLNSVLRVAANTGILFILGTSGATTLPRIVTRDVLANNGFVVEVNIDSGYFTETVKNHKKGIAISQGSSEFLTELESTIREMKSNR
jgi:NAD-dependent deacetylase